LKHHDASHHVLPEIAEISVPHRAENKPAPIGQWHDLFHISANQAIRMVRMPHGNGGQNDDMQLTTDTSTGRSPPDSVCQGNGLTFSIFPRNSHLPVSEASARSIVTKHRCEIAVPADQCCFCGLLNAAQAQIRTPRGRTSP
jgi:hypothetical protein